MKSSLRLCRPLFSQKTEGLRRFFYSLNVGI